MRPLLFLAWALFTGLCAFLQNKYCCTANTNQANNAAQALLSKNFQLTGEDGWKTSCATATFLQSSNQLLSQSDALNQCLEAIATYQANHPEQTWDIIGNYANFEENTTIFQNLGEARAQQIKQILVEKYSMDGSLLSIKGNTVDSAAFNVDTLLYGYRINRGPNPSPSNTTLAENQQSDGESLAEPNSATGSGTAIAQFDNSKPIMLRYAFNSSVPQLNAEIRNQFQDLLSDLDNFKDLNVQVTGHTDKVGDPTTNLKLGMERAQSIKDYLINNGLAASRITINSKGETQPISQDAAINRRVEVTVQ